MLIVTSFTDLALGGNRGKELENGLAARAVPEMTNNLVIQKLCIMRSNDFVVASNTADSKHEHRRLFLHRA